MPRINVWPPNDTVEHQLDFRGCKCEPEIIDMGLDGDGLPARIFVHNRMSEKPAKYYFVKKESFKRSSAIS